MTHHSTFRWRQTRPSDNACRDYWKWMIIVMLAQLEIPASAGAAVEYRAVAISGQQAPGLAPGVTLLAPFQETTFLSFPRIDNAGRVISFIAMGGTASSALGGNGQSIWIEDKPGGVLTLLARQGDHAPGTEPTTVFEGFPSPLQPSTPGVSNGHTTFTASMRGPGIVFGQTNNAFGIFSSGSGPLALLARSGQQAPGLPAGVVFDRAGGTNPFTGGIINAAGHVLHGAFLGGPGVTSATAESIWSDRTGSFQLVLRSGDPAPGTTAVFGASPQSFSPGGLRTFAFNDQSRMALYGNLTGSGIDFLNDEGVWVEGPAGLELIAREGAAAPGTPWTFGEGGVDDMFAALTFNHAGRVAFRAGLSDESMVSGVGTLWSNRTGPLQMIVGPGINQPGVVPGSVTGAFRFSLSHTNRIAFVAGILKPGKIFSSDNGIWSDRSGSMELLARSGDPAPGVDSGVVLDSFFVTDGRDFFKLASSGVIGFRARLTGAGVSGANDLAFYISDSAGDAHLVLREGQLFDIGAAFGGEPGIEQRQILDMLPGGMNEQGEWGFKVLFDDGRLAILTARIDMPPSIPGDLDGDGDVDGLDLGILLANWSIPVGTPGCGGSPGSCIADLNSDGVVDGLDLGILISHWG